jgi:catechol 2,3-dioxygenase-like lactoylglutathione lyase family enzyme
VVPRLDHVVIAVSDVGRSNAFYREVLGAEVIERGGGFAYAFDGQRLNVHSPEISPYPVAEVPVRPGGSDLCFVWDGPIEDAVEHLGRNEVEIDEGPVDREGAAGPGRSVYFRDPDSSLLEFISYG